MDLSAISSKSFGGNEKMMIEGEKRGAFHDEVVTSIEEKDGDDGAIALTTIFSVLAVFLQVFVAMGVTRNDSLLQKVAWSRGTFREIGKPHSSEEYKIWIGCEHYVLDVPGKGIIGIDWDDARACTLKNATDATEEQLEHAKRMCEECRNQSGPNIVTAILAVIFALQGVRFNVARSGDASTDLNSYKALGAFHCTSVIFFNVLIITSFWTSCVTHFSDAAPDNTFMPGVGLIFLLVIVGIKFVNLVVHLSFQTPIGRRPVILNGDELDAGVIP
eukprot:g3074.t1